MPRPGAEGSEAPDNGFTAMFSLASPLPGQALTRPRSRKGEAGRNQSVSQVSAAPRPGREAGEAPGTGLAAMLSLASPLPGQAGRDRLFEIS